MDKKLPREYDLDPDLPLIEKKPYYLEMAEHHTEDLERYREWKVWKNRMDEWAVEEKAQSDTYLTGLLLHTLPKKVTREITDEQIETAIDAQSAPTSWERESLLKEIAKDLAMKLKQSISKTKPLSESKRASLEKTSSVELLAAITSNERYERGEKYKTCPFPHDIYQYVLIHLKQLYPHHKET